MKILMTNVFPLIGSGSGVYTQNIANALVRQGHEVSVIFTENKAVDFSDYKFRCHPIYFTADDGTKPQVSDKILNFNFPCFTTHPRSTFKYEDMTQVQEEEFGNAFRKAIKQEVEEFKPDVIHCGHIWQVSAIAAEFSIPLCITCHGTDIQGYVKSDRFHKYCNAATKTCGAIICISDKNTKEVYQYFPEHKNKAHTMPNGYDSHIFYPEIHNRKNVLAQHNIVKPYKYLVSFAGKFTHFKGIDILLHAAKIYETDEIATVLAGDGTLFDDMTKLRNNLNLKHVYFIHNQPHNKLRQLYSVADVSLAPSRNEPFGLVVIEANACGAPVIGTNDGGIAGILTKDTGILIDPEDSDALAKSVEDILYKKIEFDRTNVANITKQKFSQDSLILKTIDLYKSII